MDDRDKTMLEDSDDEKREAEKLAIIERLKESSAGPFDDSDGTMSLDA